MKANRTATHLAEELLEILRLFDLVGRLDATLADRFLKELGHFEANLEQLAFLLILFVRAEGESQRWNVVDTPET